MRAVLLDRYGPPATLRPAQPASRPLAHDDDVRVEVRAAGVNPVDWKIRAGIQRGLLWLRLPWVLGLDVAGVVTEVGPGVRRLAVGDAVLGCPDWWRWGSYATSCVVREPNLVRKPPELSFEEAAGLPLAGLTAWQCLAARLQARPGQRVLVQAGAGGVGHLAIQLARHLGAWVATTCSPRNAGFVRELGASQVVDYRTERWDEVVHDLDVVLDALGGEERRRAVAAVRRGGRVASIANGLPQAVGRWGPWLGVAASGLSIAGFWARGAAAGVDASVVVKQTRTDELQALAELAAEGVLRVHVDRTVPLDDAAAAHAYGEQGHIRGKVVLVP